MYFMTWPQKSTLCYFSWLNISAQSAQEGILNYRDAKILEAYPEGCLHHNAVWTMAMANQIS